MHGNYMLFFDRLAKVLPSFSLEDWRPLDINYIRAEFPAAVNSVQPCLLSGSTIVNLRSRSYDRPYSRR